ncbi:MAG TPA: hypothetical protein GXX72_07025 [Clostridiaceae bacterium]|nr:hypothetical protein [Clostridiaceae bacterium]
MRLGEKNQVKRAANNTKRLFMRPTDLLIVGLILLIGLIIFLWNRHQAKTDFNSAHIFCDNELIAVVPLNSGEDKDISFAQCPEIVFHLYAEGEIAFVVSSCPDKICIKSGKLSGTGEWAACLPNRVLLRIIGNDSEQNPDAIDLIS